MRAPLALVLLALSVGQPGFSEDCAPRETKMKTFYSCNEGATRIEVNLCDLNDVQFVSTEPKLIENLKKAGAYPFRTEGNRTIENEALFRGKAKYKVLSAANLGSFESESKANGGGNAFYVYRKDSGYKLAVRKGRVDYNTTPDASWYLPEDEIFASYFGDCKDVSKN